MTGFEPIRFRKKPGIRGVPHSAGLGRTKVGVVVLGSIKTGLAGTCRSMSSTTKNGIR